MVKLIIKRIIFSLFLILILGLLIPENLTIPVKDATNESWHRKSFWYYPWKESITHKGIDIFAPRNSLVLAPTHGIILSVETSPNGGNVLFILGPKWRTHYFAHLQQILVKKFQFLSKGEVIGTVGNTGNARNTYPHLHYSIFSVIPYPWKYDEFAEQGALKMFYLNPVDYFE